jgi:O-antigen biosynthesis protein
LLWALRPPASDRPLVLRAFAGVLSAGKLVDIPPAARFSAVDLAALVLGLEPHARVSLVSALLGVWSSVFHLRRNPAFIRAVRKLTMTIAPTPAPAIIEAGLTAGRTLFRAELPLGLGEVKAIYVVAGKGIEHLPRRWHLGGARARSRALRLIAGTDLVADDRLVVVGENGIVIRRPGQARRVRTLSEWWRTQATASNGGLREFLVRALGDASPAGQASALEFQIRAPLRAHQLSGRGGMPSASIEIALAEKSGLFVGGWFRDPSGFIDRLEAEDETGAMHPVEWLCFQGIPTPGNPIAPTGFIGIAKTLTSDALILQPRFVLHLRSGTKHRLVPKPQPADPVARRARVLKAVPPEHLSDTIMAEYLAPVLGDLQAAVNRSLPAPKVEQISAPIENPAISIVVPLYRNLEFLRAQVAALAADPCFALSASAAAELIYVLDSPEQVADVRNLLQGLNLLYGIPITLAVMARNGGYAAANNAGALIARGSILVMLNSDVVPVEPGWLKLLAERFLRSPKTAICGPKLLYEDGAIQHAGMYFAKSHVGRWLNHHFHKGMPRGFAPANVDRLVPAVTGACLVVRREIFDAVGGFTDDYVIGDYEDSDLCLKVRRAGYEIAYVPAAELYHLERQSIRKSDDYMRGSADRYNSWLHSTRWADDMIALMAAPSEPQLRSAA